MKTIEFTAKIENGTIKIPTGLMEFNNRNVKIALLSSSITDEADKSDAVVVNIKKELLKVIELDKIKNYLEQQLKYLYIEQIKSNIDKSIIDSSVDNDLLLENARSSAWNNYKNYFLKDIKRV